MGSSERFTPLCVVAEPESARALKECWAGCGMECPGAEPRLVGLSSADSLTGPRAGPACICLPSGLPARTLRPAARSSALRCGPVSLPRARRSKKEIRLLLCLREGACILR